VSPHPGGARRALLRTAARAARLQHPATFIWCCLEEGLGPSETVAAYAEAFATAPAEAQRQVADMLHRWQGLGYVSGVEIEGASEIDLTTALGRL